MIRLQIQPMNKTIIPVVPLQQIKLDTKDYYVRCSDDYFLKHLGFVPMSIQKPKGIVSRATAMPQSLLVASPLYWRTNE